MRVQCNSLKNLLGREGKQRDEQAFREFVEDNQDRVFNLIYRIIGDWEEARDLSQEVFVSAFKTLDGFRGKSLLSTWLYRIAANHAKNRLKYLSRRAREKTDSLDSVPEGALNEFFQQQISRPDEQAIGHELEIIVQKALIQLEEDYRIILILRDVEHLT